MTNILTIAVETVIHAPVEAVWQVAADEFGQIDRWDANVKSSTARRPADDAAQLGGRVCDQYNGRKTVEELVEFDPERRTFTYAITQGLPGFVVFARNTWRHQPLDSQRTRLNMTIVMQVRGLLGNVMRLPLKSQMEKVLRNAQEELKHYIETGSTHPRKQKRGK